MYRPHGRASHVSPGPAGVMTPVEFGVMGGPRNACRPAPRGRWGRLCTSGGQVAVALTAASVLGGVTASVARADGDPASDALISSNVFYPYSSPVAQSAQNVLNRAVAAAHRDGVPLKVAIIARASDLGSVNALFSQPQRYASFLDTEISFMTREPLLIVMANGDGVEGLTPHERRAALAAPRAAGQSGGALAVAALGAVRRIDDDLSSPGGSDATARLPPVLLPALVLAAAFAVALLVIVSTVFPAT